MKYSDVIFLLWMIIWALSTTIDFAISFGGDKATSVVIESKDKPETKTETTTEIKPSAGW